MCERERETDRQTEANGEREQGRINEREWESERDMERDEDVSVFFCSFSSFSRTLSLTDSDRPACSATRLQYPEIIKVMHSMVFEIFFFSMCIC